MKTPVQTAAVGGSAFLVYLSTLAPGLVAQTDAPAFQLAGPVLGVPHPPGYPVFVVIGHLFSLLPFGSPAYRMNLFSATWGAVAVALCFLVMRRLGARPMVAGATALAGGLAGVFWSSAVVAEVYTMEAALVAGMVLGLLVWRETRRPAGYYASVGCLALSLGHHTTDVLLAPAMGLFVLSCDARWALRPRRLALTATLLALGLLPYGFILVRTWQQAPMLESPANTLADLVAVIAARRFADSVFVFTAAQLVTERLPLIVGVLVRELTPVGLAAAAIGGWSFVSKRSPVAWLLLLGPVGFLVFAANYDVIDPDVFLLPALLLGWMAAAVGFEHLLRLAERTAPNAARLAMAGVVAFPAAQFALNLHESDHHRDRSAIRYFDALFDHLPARSVVLREDFLVDRMVSYELIGEHRGRGRYIQGPADAHATSVDGLAAGEQPVFAFSKQAWWLRLNGFDFRPVVIPGAPWPTYVDDLPDGFVVAVASPTRIGVGVEIDNPRGLTAIGVRDQLMGRRLGLAAVGVRGTRRPAAASLDAWQAEVSVVAGREIGDTSIAAPATITARADQLTAAILVDGREIVRTDSGIAIAVWDHDGEFRQAVVADETQAFRVPIVNDGGFWPGLQLFRLNGPRTCLRLDPDGWVDVTRLAASGGVTVDAPGGARVELSAEGPASVAPRLTESGRSGALALDVEERRKTADSPDDGASRVRATLTASGPAGVRVMSTVVFDAVPTALLARVTTPGGGAETVTACAARYDGFVRPVDHRTLAIGMSNNEQAMLLGRGWGPSEGEPWAPPLRQTVGAEAQIVVPLDQVDVERVRLEARPAPGTDSGAAAVLLRVNGLTLAAQTLDKDWASYEWTVPPGTFTTGVNLLSVLATCGASSSEACRLQVGGVTLARR